MEYDVNLSATWKKLGKQKVFELYKMVQNATKLGSGNKDIPLGLSREMQMVPKYLELATYKNKYRFNDSEIKELTSFIKMYKSEISSTDLVKQLLNIGIEKGQPLSAKEIKDFLSTTALMNKKEQINIIKFIKSLKENAPIYSDKTFANKTLNNKNMVQYNAYSNKSDLGASSVSKLINLSNLEFVYGITRCEKPEILAKIAQNMGPMKGISVVPNDLVKVYELSKGNMALIQDLLRGFYPWEIDKIVSKLTEKPIPVDLSKYTNQTYSTDYVTIFFSAPGLEKSREIILSKLGLSNEIELSSLSHSRKIRVVDGSFEQGKRR